MKKYLVNVFGIVALAICLAAPVFADTIRLKDGSVIHGQVVGFQDQQFIIMVGSGARGRRSRITIYMEDVESIEFDAATNGGPQAANSEANSIPAAAQPAPQPSPQPSPPSNNPQPDVAQPAPQPEATPAPTASPTFFQINVKVRADNTNNGWTNSGLVVRRGQRLKITASGRVSLGHGRFSGPEGLPNLPDKDKLMRNQATGGVIGVIGDDNDDFIYIGRTHEFVAQRDGVLFLGVNLGNLNESSGTFDAVIEAEASGGTRP